MSARRSTGERGKPRTRTALCRTTALAAVGSVVLGAGSAAADPVSLTLKYACSFPVVGPQAVSMKVDADIPRSIRIGTFTPRFALDGVATVVDSTTAQGLTLAGVRTVEGTVDASASVAAPGVPNGSIPVPVTFDLATTEIPAAGPFDLEATATAPVLSFKQPGTAQIIVGDLVLHLDPKDANGNTVLGELNVQCTLEPAQNTVLASLDITGATGPSSPATNPPPTPAGTATSTTSSAAVNGVHDEPGKPGPAGRPKGWLATGGLIALALGILAAGGAAALRFASRSRRRRSGDG